MVLFIHGIHQSAGVFLPLIRSMLGHSSDFDDKHLIDSFCLWLPGYDKQDCEFDYKYIENQIYDFVSQKSQTQIAIASKLLFTNFSLPAQIIKDSKLNLIGCDVGAGLALDFTAYNPEAVASLVMLDCGVDLKTLRAKWTIFKTNRLLTQPASYIASKYQSQTDLYKKILLSSISTYPSLKGIKSYLQLFKNYNFVSTFQKIAIDQQKQLCQVKILSLVDNKLGLSNNSSVNKLQNTLNQKYQRVSKTSIFIKTQSRQNLQIERAPIGNKSILNQQVAINIAKKLKSFYNN
jgi:hypothetical protein